MKQLTSSMDNVLAWRMGECANASQDHSAGDLIDRGLILLRLLNSAGFGVVERERKADG